jgi:hypothetical protein
MKAIKYIFILAVAAFIFNSCTKNVAGPAGPKGATGPQGNSSSYSVFIDSVEVSAPGTWAADPSISGYSFTMTNISALTNPNTSIVDVYYATSLNTLSAIWYTLPVSSSLQTGDVFQYYYDAYSVTVQYIFATPPPQKLYFKVVIITHP